MADRLYTSSEADDVLSALRFETKLEKAVPNHPSGNLIPSKDILITQKLKAAAQVLGINFLDHIIFGKKGYYSFLEKKQL